MSPAFEQLGGRPWAAGLAAVVCLALAFLAGRQLGTGIHEALGPFGRCPSMPLHLTAQNVHVSPNILEHQNWIDFAANPEFVGYFAFCVDGRFISGGAGQLEVISGRARFHVSTTWVDWQWLRGTLGTYASPDRWQLALECAAEMPCQAAAAAATAS